MAATTSQSRSSGAPTFPQARILVADRDEIIRRTFRTLFEQKDHIVLETADSQQALEHIARADLDVVFLDLNLSKTRATTLLQTARQLAPGTVFIVLAGLSSVDQVSVAVRCGAFNYILKPSPEQQIVQVLEASLIERQRRLRQRSARGVQRSAPKGAGIAEPAPIPEGAYTQLLDAPGFTADGLWAVADYLSRAVSAYEKRMYQRAVQSISLPPQPYKSLYAYEVEDSAIFFGRTDEIETLHDQLLENRLLVLHGKSGVGKTSLINAGLAPRLIRGGRLPVYVRVYGDPLRAIKQAIAPPFLEPWPDLLDAVPLLQVLTLCFDYLSSQTRELVLILDQFEEFLIFWPERKQRQAYFDALAACYNERTLPIRIVIALRGEYFSELAQFADRIPPIMQNHFWLDALSRTEAQEAITQPVQKRDPPVIYESDLLEALLDDLSLGGPTFSHTLFLEDRAYSAVEGIEPPQLQLVCSRMYAALDENGSTIALRAYEQLGRAEGILDDHLMGFLDQLPAAQATLAKGVLKELVSSRATRRMLTESALAAAVESNTRKLAEVLTQLVEARLVHHSEFAGESTYELAHDYLISQVKRWIDRADLMHKRVQELIARELENWREHGSLLPRRHLQLLQAYRESLTTLDAEARLYLLRSALKTGFAIEDWAGLAGVSGERLLWPAITDQRKDVRRAVVRALGGIWQMPEASMLASDDADVRRSGAEALGEMGDARVVELLIASLADETGAVRAAAARALGQLHDQRALDPLLTLLTDSDREARLAAINTLGMLNDDRAVDSLISVLADQDPHTRRAVIRALGALWEFPELTALGDEDRYVGWAAARKLGELGDPRAADYLVIVLRDPNVGLRRAAAAALVDLGQHAVGPLIPVLEDEDWDVRRMAVETLSEIGDLRAVEPLTRTLRDRHSDVRKAAAAALVKFGEAALEPFLSALGDADSHLRVEAAESLGRLGLSRAVVPLVGAVRDVNSGVRQAAAQALVTLGDPSVEPLIGLLQDKDHYVRRAAAKALGEIGDRRAVEPLIAALEDQDPFVRRTVADALDEIGDPRAIESFIGALQDDDRFVRREAAWALGEFRVSDAVGPLIVALRDLDRGVRQAAAAALVKFGGPAVEPLSAALYERDSGLRWAIIGVLGDLGDPRATEALINALRDEDKVVRRAAAAALSKISDVRAVVPLVALLQDQDSGVRWTAIGGLGQLGDARAVKPLAAFLTDEDSSVRRAVADALKKIGTPEALDALSAAGSATDT